MTSNDYVKALYRLLFNRPPDPKGLHHWSELIANGSNPMDVLQAFLVSEEYRRRNGESEPESLRTAVIHGARQMLRGHPLFIVDVGAQILAWEDHIYQPLIASDLSCEVLGFEPLAHRLRERADKERNVSLTLLPYAIGDGKPHTLHVNNDDGTSSLYPLNPEASRNLEGLDTLYTVRTERLATRRLDDVLPQRPVHFLKLDIQGFELRALEHAVDTLFRTAVVHCEVEFYPLYVGQPLFPQVHSFLTVHGFEFIDLVKPTRLSPAVPSGRKGPERLVFADAVFFRKCPPQERELLQVQAMIALLVYQKPVLAEALLRQCEFSARPEFATAGMQNSPAPPTRCLERYSGQHAPPRGTAQSAIHL
jgi:FkbM family methyltransferase